ncbi:MAG: hypothetical protein KAS71_07615 [Bacteroidales bacterium]|nr:hypothetical protein [Bacteroidales bacterium]
MNADQAEIFGTLRGRVKELMTALDLEKMNGSNLKKEFEVLKKKSDQKIIEYKDLEQKYNNLKLAKVLTSETEESHDAKIKVNGIVREIDKCIALLNR